MSWSYATHYKCDDCKIELSMGNRAVTTCPDCGGLLEVQYNFEELKKKSTPSDFKNRDRSIWRWHEFLPLKSKENIVSMGEGDTPLLPSIYIGGKLGLEKLYFKNDTLMPTGSFKDRGFSLAISYAKEIGITEGMTYSSGNAGMSFSAYAQRANMKTLTLVEYLANPLKQSLITLSGGKTAILHYKSMNEITQLLEEASRELNIYQFVNFINPIRHEAMKTYAYEISEALGWESPDYMIHPVGTGGGLWGAWKGFKELYELQWISKLPKMVAVQPSATGPHVKAFNQGKKVAVRVGDPTKTIAQSISADAPIQDGKRVLNALYESNGYAEEVTDEEIIGAMKDLGREGIVADPASAASVAGLKRLVQRGLIDSKSTIVCVITGGGLKQPKLIESLGNEDHVHINPDLSELSKLIKGL